MNVHKIYKEERKRVNVEKGKALRERLTINITTRGKNDGSVRSINKAGVTSDERKERLSRGIHDHDNSRT